MKVSEAMSRDVEVARPDDSIQSIARRMADLDIGSMPVCDGRLLKGMVTDRDIVVRGLAEGHGGETPVSAVMTPDLEYIFDDEDLGQAADKMAEAQVRRLPVVDRDKRLVGILALGDLAGKVREGTAGHTLEEISEPNRRI